MWSCRSSALRRRLHPCLEKEGRDSKSLCGAGSSALPPGKLGKKEDKTEALQPTGQAVRTGKACGKSCHCLYREVTHHTCSISHLRQMELSLRCLFYHLQRGLWAAAELGGLWAKVLIPAQGWERQARRGCGRGGAYKAGRNGCRSHQSQGDSFQLLTASPESGPRSLLS